MSHGYSKRGRGKARAKGVLLLCATLFFAAGFFYYCQRVISPAVDDIAKIRAGSMITQLANEAMRAQFQKEGNVAELLIIKTNNEGNIELVQSNTKAINQLLTELSAEIQKKYTDMDAVELSVPLGTLLGNKILSQAGPYVDIKILPISIIAVDFKTEFDTQGINQTKYKVYAVFNSRAKVMAPFSKSTFEVSNTVLIAEAVILGQVPGSYVNVPSDELTNIIGN